MSGVDKRGILDENIFSAKANKAGLVFIYCRGRLVKTLKGPAGQRLLDKIAALSPHEAQLVMAGVTGNFKRGNERARPDPSGE